MKMLHKGDSAEFPGRGQSVVPLYHRVYVVLLQKISDGSFPPDRSMPSEDELATSFGVSRVTIRKAMERLQREGLVRRERGRGTFPQPAAIVAEADTGNLLSNQLSLAQRTRVSVLDHRFARPPANVAARLATAPDEEVLLIERVRRDAISPISHTRCYLPADLAQYVPRRRITSIPVSAMLAAAGVKLLRYHETITATLADSDTAAHLDVDVGAALISMSRCIEGDGGRPLEILHALYRPDRYEYRVEFSPQTQGESWHARIMDSRE